MKRFAQLILILAIASSCNHIYIYDEYVDINSDSWHFKERVFFKFEVSDTSSYYDVFLNIRNTGDFSYSNLWLNCTKKRPDGQEVKQNFEFTLATPDGRWLGKGLGDIIDNQFILEEKVKLNQEGTYTYFVNHEMREDDIEGILNLGITVKKHIEDQNI